MDRTEWHSGLVSPSITVATALKRLLFTTLQREKCIEDALHCVEGLAYKLGRYLTNINDPQIYLKILKEFQYN